MQSNTAFLKNRVWWLCFGIISIAFLVSNRYFNNYAENIFSPSVKLLVYSVVYLVIWGSGLWGLKRIQTPAASLKVWHLCYGILVAFMYLLGIVQLTITTVPDYIKEVNAQCRAFLFTPFPYLVLSYFRS